MHISFHAFCYGGQLPEATISLISELQQISIAGADLSLQIVSDDPLVCRARSIALSRAISDEADVCFMVDRDISWTPGDVLAICQKALEKNAVIAGAYMRRDRVGPALQLLEPGPLKISTGGDRLIPVEWAGTGFMAIPTKIATAMIAIAEKLNLVRCGTPLANSQVIHFYNFFETAIDTTTTPAGFIGEDVLFCRRAREAGSAIFVWEKPKLLHFATLPLSL